MGSSWHGKHHLPQPQLCLLLPAGAARTAALATALAAAAHVATALAFVAAAQLAAACAARRHVATRVGALPHRPGVDRAHELQHVPRRVQRPWRH